VTQNGGIDLLVAWVSFGVLLATLVWIVLRHHTDVLAALRRAGELGDVAGPRGEDRSDEDPDR